jgi:hypothetical protein
MAFMPEVDTGFGKFALGVAVGAGAVEADCLQALSVNASITNNIRVYFLLMFFLLSSMKWAGYVRVQVILFDTSTDFLVRQVTISNSKVIHLDRLAHTNKLKITLFSI